MCNTDVIILSRRHYGVVALADVTMSSGLGYGLGWQIAGTVAIAAATGYSLLPVMLPKFTKRFYAKYSKETNEPLPIDDGDLQLVASVSVVLFVYIYYTMYCTVYILYNVLYSIYTI